MPSNFGIFTEEEMAMAINNKRVCELPKNLRYTLFRIYGPLEEEEIVHADRLRNHMKPDIWVEYKGIKKYISIKSGRATELHQEKLETFVPFLKQKGLSEESCKFLKEYCYGDGTDDGSGEQAYEFVRLKEHFRERSALFNKEVISKPDLVNEVLYRCIFGGAIQNGIEADYIYFGDAEYGNIMSWKQLKKHTSFRTWGFMDNPHFGPLQFKAKIRGQARNPEKEYLRHCVELWWANLEPDLRFISNRYNL